tara:strand:+ start:13254 stop:13598 length:345 start_codon:yes stop_codon:yes gene_type:complete
MKAYHLYVFVQDSCTPCQTLKEHISKLSKAQQEELDLVPLKTPNGSYTALAEELKVDLSPTLVVVHEDHECETDRDGDEWCDFVNTPVETYIGAKDIIKNLASTLDAYTYSNPE